MVDAVTKRAGMFSARQQAMLLDVLSKHSEAFPERTLVADLMQGYGASQAPGVRGAADFQVDAQLAVAVRATAQFAPLSTQIKLWVRLPR